MSQRDVDELRDLQRRVANNVPHHGDPERFHAEKSEIVEGIKAVMKRLEQRLEGV